MATGFSGLSGGLPSVPRATRWLLGLFVGLSLANVLLSGWLQVADLDAVGALVPGAVWRGQVWRLATYPFFAADPFGLLFGAMLLVFMGGALESAWGSRTFLWHSLWMTVVPGLLTALLALVVPALQLHPFMGLSALGMGYVTAFACRLRGAQVAFFPLPISLSGDQLLWFEGGLLLLWILFSRTIVPFVPELMSFLLAMAWFRFDLGRRWRRRRLQSRKGRVESRLEKLARQRRLHVVRNDDDDDDRPSPDRSRLH